MPTDPVRIGGQRRMPTTYTPPHYHLVFAMKRRERHSATAIETRVWEYLAGIAK